MAIHLYMWLAMFLGALYWSKHSLMNRGGGVRWRQFVSALLGAVMWVPIAYTSTSLYVGTSTVTEFTGGEPLGYFAVLMAIVMFLTAIISMVMWTQEEAEAGFEALDSDLLGPQN